MLLTNTIITQTTNAIIATGNAIVCGAEFRGYPVCPATLADRPSEKPERKRISERVRPVSGKVLRAMDFGDQMSWQLLCLDRSSHQTASGHGLGIASGHSLS